MKKLFLGIFISMSLPVSALEILDNEKAIIIDASDLMVQDKQLGIDLVRLRNGVGDLSQKTNIDNMEFETENFMRTEPAKFYGISIAYKDDDFKESQQVYFYCSNIHPNRSWVSLYECVKLRDYLREKVNRDHLPLKMVFGGGHINKFVLLNK